MQHLSSVSKPFWEDKLSYATCHWFKIVLSVEVKTGEVLSQTKDDYNISESISFGLLTNETFVLKIR